MSDNIYDDIADIVIGALRGELMAEVKASITAEMQQYRATYICSDKWCCRPMTQFMTEVFGATKPMSEEGSTYGSAYSLRNNTLNYCPFCGVKL